MLVKVLNTLSLLVMSIVLTTSGCGGHAGRRSVLNRA
jgi:hypothetical protein